MSTNPKPKEEAKQNPWVEYERRKRDLPENLSQREREVELRKIADELGI